MKKTVFCLAALILFSCSSNSEDPSGSDLPQDEMAAEDPNPEEETPEPSALLGTWNLVDVEVISGTAMLDVFGMVVNRDLAANPIDIDATLTFDEMPNDYASDGRFQWLIEVTAGGSTGFFVDDFLGAGSWSEEEDILTTISEGVEKTHEIEEVTETTLKIISEVDMEFQDFDREAIVNGVVRYSLEKM